MNQIEEWMNSRIGLNFRSGLGRMQQAVKLLGAPHEAVPMIHVTGTNGKGSTIAFMRQLFQQHGLKVGTFTSPHIVSMHDRICINGQPISEQDLIRLGQSIQAMESQLLETHDQLSYFEIITLLAFLYFHEQKVDLALIEVGIGGLLDTTNVITGEVAVITSVGLDHQETLGGSLEAIARQKAGIFKAEKPAVIGPLAKEAEQVCIEKAQAIGCPLARYGEDFQLVKGVFQDAQHRFDSLKIGLNGAYQEENAAVALEAFLLFMEQRGLAVDENGVREALQATSWPGRLENFDQGVYLDGAHNPHAIHRLVEYAHTFSDKRVKILFGALKRKDYQGMLEIFASDLPEADLTVTTFAYGEVVQEADGLGYPYVADFRDYLQDFYSRQDDQEVLFVTGSLYFISEVRAYLLEQGKNPL
ncbi:bifunctional folylpolyglutamate synthase/dihydrofolate synthase [Streptococcus australis]|jgi:dihydrofolate synthase/folylpolyglutamate synthase|uniref:bifunctional folylpolyglutamate synthase/dihydrofolate synthase n=1 Tax=Streptococcus australis TaxID=113107 RepID=UPI0039C3D1BA